jgi:molecular chaperone HtpG
MDFNVPPELMALLGEDRRLSACVQDALSNFAPIFQDNKTPFFPDYTDHGIEHIERVIASCRYLMADSALALLTPQDAGALILAALLHDCAMHLSADGFVALITGQFLAPASRYSGPEATWPLLWEQFIEDASRWDGRRLHAIFGDTESIRVPPADALYFTDRDKRLIGEFLRLHHARLAHEIALNGFPGAGAKHRLTLAFPDDDLADLVGFIARSHNLSIRTACDVLPDNDRRVCFGIHAPYIMALLRIADFLQIDADRAAPQILKARALRSSISRTEWHKHDSVTGVHQLTADPEALYVDASPPTAKIFFSTKKLLRDIQEELDSTWAVLGEVFGRYKPLDQLGLRIRRIRSSMDDIVSFIEQKRPPYLPTKLAFESAGTEMLELLVRPLYGDRPEVGIRELLQNAVDACLERRDAESRRPDLQMRHSHSADSDVLIRIFESDDGQLFLEIVDQGIGMTLEVVQNYFLRIGASFRNSDTWKRAHLDPDGHSRVLRSGRFGVGVLAAFLLGRRIHVVSRHISQPETQGFAFSCEITDEVIEVRHVKAPIGTTITVELPGRAILHAFGRGDIYSNRGDWDWYCLDEPKVTRLQPLTGTPLPQRVHVPQPRRKLPPGWQKFRPRGYTAILWTYMPLSVSNDPIREPLLIHNGIRVGGEYAPMLPSPDVSPESEALSVQCPSVAVFDPDGRLPLTLQRFELVTREFPFQRELEQSVAKYMASAIKEDLPSLRDTTPADQLEALHSVRRPPGGRFRSDVWPTCIRSVHGWLPVDLSAIAQSGLETLWIDPNFLNSSAALNSAPTCRGLFVNYLSLSGAAASKTSRTQWVRSLLDDAPVQWRPSFLARLAVRGVRLFYDQELFSELQERGQLPKYLVEMLTQEHNSNGYFVFKKGDTAPGAIPFASVTQEMRAANAQALALLYLDGSRQRYADSPFVKAWKTTVGGLFLAK